MIINFNEFDKEILKNFNGGKKALQRKMYADENNKIFHGTLEPGASIGLHRHNTNSEIIYILKGCGKVLYEGTYENVSEGSCHYCPQGHEHSLINNSENDLCFLAIVSEHK